MTRKKVCAEADIFVKSLCMFLDLASQLRFAQGWIEKFLEEEKSSII